MWRTGEMVRSNIGALLSHISQYVSTLRVSKPSDVDKAVTIWHSMSANYGNFVRASDENF